MPNAQTHMASVCDLLAQPPIQAAFPWLGDDRAQAAFLLGAIAPDARALSGHIREATHFFEIPPHDPRPAPVVMLEAWPQLRDPHLLGKPQAAFVAGYVSHLIMDQTWVEMIVMRGLFVAGLHWGTEHPNWRAYSVLMTYLEYRAAARLPGRAVDLLAQAEPAGWLPFIKDEHLTEWRDHVVSVVGQGGAKLISRMFAETNHIAPSEMEAIVLSEERMDAEGFGLVTREQFRAFEAEVTQRSARAVMRYLAGELP